MFVSYCVFCLEKTNALNTTSFNGSGEGKMNFLISVLYFQFLVKYIFSDKKLPSMSTFLF